MSWLLPEFTEDVLPGEAARLEGLRRTMLDLFDVRGYDLVVPPMVSFVDSLLLDSSPVADLRAFRLVDQMSGKMMGLRPDITPQTARIDAHLLGGDGIARLCYAGSVVHTWPASYLSTREPIVIGAELFGADDIEADIEILKLAISALKAVGLTDFQVDVGHVGIVDAIATGAYLDKDERSAFFDAVKIKDRPAIEAMTGKWQEPSPVEGPRDDEPVGSRRAIPERFKMAEKAMTGLLDLYGGPEIIEKARNVLPQRWFGIDRALNDLDRIVSAIEDAPISVDLCQLRSYRYHTGFVFSIYSPQMPEQLCRGGRYDGMGKRFGRDRPATGFSIDLRTLLRVIPSDNEVRETIYCPPIGDDDALARTVDRLRAEGRRVIEGYRQNGDDQEFQGCRCELKRIDGIWQVVRS